LPGDLRRFKEITSGHTIIMGRKTFDSLPNVLPHRHHVILTRDENFSINDPQVEVVHSIEEVIKKYGGSHKETFIIGGGEIYSEFYPHCSKIYLTKVFKNFPADTHFPEIAEQDWSVIFKSDMFNENNLSYQFIDLVKNK